MNNYKTYYNNHSSFLLRSVSSCTSGVSIVKYVDDEGDNSPANQVLYGCFLVLVPF
jgi:hypothetical protein